MKTHFLYLMTLFSLSELLNILKLKLVAFKRLQISKWSFLCDVSAVLPNTNSFFCFFDIHTCFLEVKWSKMRVSSGLTAHTHIQQKNEWGKMRRKEEERPCTCSKGLRPENDLAGREGWQSWLEPAISSWYHCSKSSLDRWGLLPSDWYWRAHGGKERHNREKVEEREKRRQEEVRKHSKTAGRGEEHLFYTPLKAVITVFFFNTLVLSAALCFIPSSCHIPILHVSILIPYCCRDDPVSNKNVWVFISFYILLHFISTI